MNRANKSLLILLSLSTTFFAGCRPKQNLSLVADADIASCDEAALAAAIAADGVVKALESDAAKCLDGGAVAGEPNNAAQDAGSGEKIAPGELAPSVNSSNSSADALGLADPAHKTDLVLALGYEAMNDVLAAVSEATLNGGTSPIDGAAFKAQARDLVKVVSDTLRPLSVRVRVTVYYSYPDLEAIIKTNFVDPAVYGYDGAFHRIIHRRYANGRGLVYRIAMQKLAEGLAQFDAIANSELAAINTDAIQLGLYRHPNALTTGARSNVTLWQDGAVVGRTVEYSEIKAVALKIRETATALSAAVGKQ